MNNETQLAILLTILTVGIALVTLDSLANPDHLLYNYYTSPPTTEIDILRAELAAHIESDKRQTEINCQIDLQQSRYLFPEDMVQWQMERCMSTYRGDQP